MSTWALLCKGELKQLLEHEKAVRPFRAASWNIPNSPGHHLITTRSRTASGLPGVLSLPLFFALFFQSRAQLSLNLCGHSAGMVIPNLHLCLLSLPQLSAWLCDSSRMSILDLSLVAQKQVSPFPPFSMAYQVLTLPSISA